MFHVIRNAAGDIQSVAKVPGPESEELEENHPDIQAFFRSTRDTHSFGEADAEFVRVIEDLIDTLIAKNVIRHTDLPDAAQKKLLIRKGLRNRMLGALDLLSRDDGIL